MSTPPVEFEPWTEETLAALGVKRRILNSGDIWFSADMNSTEVPDGVWRWTDAGLDHLQVRETEMQEWRDVSRAEFIAFLNQRRLPFARFVNSYPFRT